MAASSNASLRLDARPSEFSCRCTAPMTGAGLKCEARSMPSGQILLADDDAAIRTVLNQALSRAGYEVRSTSNAATLWRWISQGEGDLVITDVMMPDENAFHLLPRRHRRGRDAHPHHRRAARVPDVARGGRSRPHGRDDAGRERLRPAAAHQKAASRAA